MPMIDDLIVFKLIIQNLNRKVNKPEYKFDLFLYLIYLDNEYIIYPFHQVLIDKDDLNHYQLIEVPNRK